MCVGVNNQIQVIKNELNFNTFLSMLYFDNNDWKIGYEAQELALSNPKNSVFGLQRILLKKYNFKAVQRFLAYYPFHVEADIDDNPRAVIRANYKEKKLYPEHYLEILFKKIKEQAEAALK